MSCSSAWAAQIDRPVQVPAEAAGDAHIYGFDLLAQQKRQTELLYSP